MNWESVSKLCLSSEEGYLISKYAMETGHVYVARSPAPQLKILHSGRDLDKAKAACTDHLKSRKGKAA